MAVILRTALFFITGINIVQIPQKSDFKFSLFKKKKKSVHLNSKEDITHEENIYAEQTPLGTYKEI